MELRRDSGYGLDSGAVVEFHSLRRAVWVKDVDGKTGRQFIRPVPGYEDKAPLVEKWVNVTTWIHEIILIVDWEIVDWEAVK